MQVLGWLLGLLVSVVVIALLFIALTPGVLLSLPADAPDAANPWEDAQLWTHGLLFGLILTLVGGGISVGVALRSRRGGLDLGNF